ncbi:MAG: glycosyltransferase family 4 protein [Phycisphaerae bacterium]|nr:glycosyltransferase family 4 protein [Phycisphaerae bacterium]
MFLPFSNMINKMPLPWSKGPVVSIWNDFRPPPYGGGNQFLLALRKEFKRLGVRVVVNDASPSVDVHLCNSAWFDVVKFRKLASSHKLRMVQRLDGSIAVARGVDDPSEDQKIYSLNAELAMATIYQSSWCFNQACQLGFKPVRPSIIHNAVDGSIFHNNGRRDPIRGRKVRLITTSWSDNPRKGGAMYQWLDDNLDWNRYEYTFAGRTKASFRNIRHMPPVASEPLAGILRRHDVFVTATQKDSCSNALLEALACGLPSIALDDGGNPELVGEGGICFCDQNDILGKLDQVVEGYDDFQSKINIENMNAVALRYLDVIRNVLLLDPK